MTMPENPGHALRGLGNHHAGQSAEEAVARHYQRLGARVTCRRWSGPRGEIDLIVTEPDGMTVFVEVKYAATRMQAASHLRASQIRRILQTAEDYLAVIHGHLDVEMRFDLALVDRLGQIDIIENALMA